MTRYFVGRVAQAFICLIFVTLIVFILARVSGDPLVLYMPPEATEEDYALERERLGLDRPLPVQYLLFVKGVFTGDLGESIRWRQPAFDLVIGRFPATFKLAAVAMAISLLIAIPLGVLSAVRKGLLDSFGKAFAIAGQSAPIFWIGLMLILVFAVILKALPAGGYGGIQYIILPAITLGWYVNAAILRLTRSSMLDVLDSEYLKTARIKGLPEWIVIWKHALKNAAIPIITMMGLQFALLLQGAVVTETIFAWPGIGNLAIQAILARDFPVIQTVVLFGAAVYIGINLIVDVLYAYIDPRIRYR